MIINHFNCRQSILLIPIIRVKLLKKNLSINTLKLRMLECTISTIKIKKSVQEFLRKIMNNKNLDLKSKIRM